MFALSWHPSDSDDKASCAGDEAARYPVAAAGSFINQSPRRPCRFFHTHVTGCVRRSLLSPVHGLFAAVGCPSWCLSVLRNAYILPRFHLDRQRSASLPLAEATLPASPALSLSLLTDSPLLTQATSLDILCIDPGYPLPPHHCSFRLCAASLTTFNRVVRRRLTCTELGRTQLLTHIHPGCPLTPQLYWPRHTVRCCLPFVH